MGTMEGEIVGTLMTDLDPLIICGEINQREYLKCRRNSSCVGEVEVGEGSASTPKDFLRHLQWLMSVITLFLL